MSKYLDTIVIDLDGTLTVTGSGDYEEVLPNDDVVRKLRSFKSNGYEIVIHTARNMRTYSGKLGKINVHTLPQIIRWLDKHQVPYDEIIVGKPWCGHDGFYVDDRAIRPDEFVELSADEIGQLISRLPVSKPG